MFQTKRTPYILKEFDAFNLKTKVSEIKAFFSETTFTHFAIIDEKSLIGLISETDVNSIDADSKEIGDFHYLLNLFFTEEINNFIEFFRWSVSEEGHPFNAFARKEKESWKT